jgi:tRNA 5-methylaminomethyl-2-thiouridine biosynthesis bifunctional protein
MPIFHPLDWRANQPYSTQFEDVYFSTENGLEETDYVFLQGNQLKERWQNAALQTFTIVETGFGTGLNFMCTAKLWLENAPKNAELHFISIEKFPLSLEDIIKTTKMWPTLADISDSFIALYQQRIEDKFKKEKSGFLGNTNIKLTLLINDVSNCINDINCKVDAWFLDGFSPAKNPEMWNQMLFFKMANLANDGCTFATFTASGKVRRGLTEAGFNVTKKAGFGKKREMLIGVYPAPSNK